MTITIINQLEAAQGETVQLLSSFNEQELNKVPHKGSWTAAQVGQHLYKAAAGIDKLIAATTAVADRDPDLGAANLKNQFLNFDIKMKSPDFIIPEDKMYNKQELISSLEQVKEDLLPSVRDANLAELAPLPEGHPLSGMTKLELVHFVVYHTMRHNHQIKTIAEAVK